MLQRLVKHLVKANGVNEETSVDSINQIDFHVLTLKEQTVNVVTSKRLLLTGLEHDSWDI